MQAELVVVEQVHQEINRSLSLHWPILEDTGLAALTRRAETDEPDIARNAETRLFQPLGRFADVDRDDNIRLVLLEPGKEYLFGPGGGQKRFWRIRDAEAVLMQQIRGEPAKLHFAIHNLLECETDSLVSRF